jgi:hypothetical protein
MSVRPSSTRATRSAGPWGLVFLLAGVGAMVSLVFVGSPVGLAVAVLAWSLTAFAGYRIWRLRHPQERARGAIGVRVRWLIAFVATIAALAFVQAFPQVALLIVGGYLALMVGFVLLLNWVQRSVDRHGTDPPPADQRDAE